LEYRADEVTLIFYMQQVK